MAGDPCQQRHGSGVVRPHYAARRAVEAETLAARLPGGCERAMLEEIARLWREIGQHNALPPGAVREAE